MLIYHITPRTEWEKAQAFGAYTTPSLNEEGFIHASTLEQVIGTANFLFRGQSDLILLVIDSDRLTAELRYELAPGTNQKFPHIYGALNLTAVQKVVEFPHSAGGTFHLPKDLT